MARLEWVAVSMLALAGTGASRTGETSRLAWCDFDGDGRLDVLIHGAGEPCCLLRNTSTGFVDVTERTGMSEVGPAEQALWQDFDGDARADLLLVAPGSSRLLVFGAGRFEDASEASGLRLAGLRSAQALDFDRDGAADLWLTDARGDHAWRNLGGALFTPFDVPPTLPAPAPAETGAVPSLPPELVARLGAALGTRMPSGGPGALAQICAQYVQDQSGVGACLPASSTPALGSLYPLSTDFNLDAAGRVGLGTTSPAHRLDVAGNVRTSGQLISSAASGAPLSVQSTTLVANLNADLLDGLSASAFSQFGPSIESNEITDGTVASADLANNSATLAKLAADAVDSSKIVNASIVAVDLANGAIGTAQLANAAVGTAQIANLAVGTAQLANGAATLAKLAADSVDSSKIVNGSIVSSDLANGAVGTAQIANGAVGTVQIANAAVGTAQLANGAATLAKLAADSVDSSKVVNASLTAADLAPGSVTGAQLFDGTIGAADFANPIVGAGNASGVVRVQATGTNSANTALVGQANGTGTGLTIGVRGLAASADGRGVYGEALATTGSTYGVYGASSSSSGTGVFGTATATTGQAYGIEGRTNSASGAGVYGYVDATAGGGAGILGEARGIVGGTAVAAFCSSSINASDGLRARTDSSAGYAVWGVGQVVGSRGVVGQAPSGSSAVHASGDLTVTGAKAFVQPHPSDPSKELRFLCLEGNESGTYFRGTAQLVGGRAVIDVPESFRLVSAADGLTVQVTALGPANLWVESKGLSQVVVRGSFDVAFDYLVNGVRRGYQDFEPLQANSSFVPRFADEPFGDFLPEVLRQLLVANGTLNADFTPRLDTAAAQGWTLSKASPAEVRQK